MLQLTPKLKKNLDSHTAPTSNVLPLAARETAGSDGLGAQKPVNALPTPQHKSNQPLFPGSTVTEGQRLQTRGPVILGEATFRGMIPVDGIINGQPGSSGGSMT